MARRACSLMIVGLLAASSSAFAPAPVYREPAGARLLEAMQGRWVYVFQSRDVDRGTISTVTQEIQVENKTWRSKYTTKGFAPDNQEYEIVLDATKTPATLDLVRRGKDGVHVEMLGIVRWEGDALTYRFAMTWEKGATRPRSFDATERLPNGKTPYTIKLKRPK